MTASCQRKWCLVGALFLNDVSAQPEVTCERDRHVAESLPGQETGALSFNTK